MAITLVLLTGTGLFLRSVTAALALNPGYDAANLASGAISLPEGYSEAGADALFRTIRDRMEASPAITSASVTSRRGAMSSGGELIVNGIGRRFPTAVSFTAVDEFYFPTIGLEVIGGRNFTGSDAGGRPVAIVSESLARALGPDRARGSRIAAFWTTAEGDRPEFEVVGVVPDLITDVAVLEPLTLYLPSSQRAGAVNRELIFRSAGDLATAVEEATSIVRSEDSDIRLRPFRSLEQRISEQMGAQRFGVSVMSGLGVITVVLTGVGIYVLTELLVARRRQELAIRAALGAGRLGSGDGNHPRNRSPSRPRHGVRPRHRVDRPRSHPLVPLSGAAARHLDPAIGRGRPWPPRRCRHPSSSRHCGHARPRSHVEGGLNPRRTDAHLADSSPFPLRIPPFINLSHYGLAATLARSMYRHTPFAIFIWRGVRHSGRNRSGLPTSMQRARAREVATLNQNRL